MARKTIDIAEFTTKMNRSIRITADSNGLDNETKRERLNALCHATETALFMADNYGGFRYIDDSFMARSIAAGTWNNDDYRNFDRTYMVR